MSGNEMHWVLITDAPASLDWPNNQLLDLEVEDKKITLARFKEDYFAFAQKCPHASGRMAQGYINPLGQVVCPLHRYAFDMKNGRNTTGEGYFLKTYPVELRPNGLFIGFKPNSFF
ncbi:MAG: Rieske 2Fe-2S domain-containing protein [Chitinophagia bacterium]